MLPSRFTDAHFRRCIACPCGAAAHRRLLGDRAQDFLTLLGDLLSNRVQNFLTLVPQLDQTQPGHPAHTPNVSFFLFLALGAQPGVLTPKALDRRTPAATPTAVAGRRRWWLPRAQAIYLWDEWFANTEPGVDGGGGRRAGLFRGRDLFPTRLVCCFSAPYAFTLSSLCPVRMTPHRNTHTAQTKFSSAYAMTIIRAYDRSL